MRSVYWGDLHSHCAISYGYGSIERAFMVARQHLDFCTVTGHATWHDMPTDRERYGRIIDFHREGFDRLAENWQAVETAVEEHNADGEFITLLSYEWHSRRYGDHNVYYPGARGPIVDGESLDDLERNLAGRQALIIPHHIGYGPGFRGIDWDEFDERLSPVVEIMSGHGSSERDGGPYPMYHTMGPRSFAGTVANGLRLGKRFGFVGGTDHHGGYPGHHGEGRTAVIAAGLSREAIIEAIRLRHCYAVTGDKILLDFSVNDAIMGDEIGPTEKREVSFEVVAGDVIDRLEVVKNNRVLRRYFPDVVESPGDAPTRCKVRVEWGWGDKDEAVKWDGRLRLAGGRIVSLEPCFNGQPVLAPSGEPVDVGEGKLHDYRHVSDTELEWTSTTRGNPHPFLRGTSALIVELEADPSAVLRFDVNGRTFSHSLAELLEGSRSEFLRGWRSEAVLVHRAAPLQAYTMRARFEDLPSGDEPDFYYLRVAQENGQWAWSSPIWVEGR